MAVVRTTTVTVNAAFLQEIKEVNEDLWHLLAEVRRYCQRGVTSHAGCCQLLEALGALRDQMALHFALEEAYGYFDEPVYVAPRLSEQAAELRNEHRALYLDISNFVEDAERLNYRKRLPAAMPQLALRYEAFQAQFEEHEAREHDLILQAYDDDIGVGD